MWDDISLYNLDGHMRRYHDEPDESETTGKHIMQFKCDKCEDQLNTMTKLKYHNITVHERNRDLNIEKVKLSRREACISWNNWIFSTPR